jgi:hypothetical protein
MVETPQLPPDPESSSDKFIAELRRQVLWASRGKLALESADMSPLLSKEATPPESDEPKPKLVGMLLEREYLIDQIQESETDPTSARVQLGSLQREIYDEKSALGIPVVDTPNLPLDNDN